MEIYELKNIDYYINEKEAFDKSVFNPAEYTVTLAVKAGTNLDNFIKKGQQVSGTYTVNGLTTNFESLVQELAISRDFQAGYDMYNLTLSENVLNVDRASILDVQDGGTGRGELHGILKGNGMQPIETAEPGIDYVVPVAYDTDFVPVVQTEAVSNTDRYKWYVRNSILYVDLGNIRVDFPDKQGVVTIGQIELPEGVQIASEIEDMALLRVSGWMTVRVIISPEGKIVMARPSSSGAIGASVTKTIVCPLIKVNG